MVYQILGWPRSRTAWLATYLTYGNSFCFHEGISDVPNKRIRSVNQYRKLFSKFLEKYKHVGDANTYSLLKQRYVLPEARIVIIERDRKDLEQSLANLGFNAAIPKIVEYPYNKILVVKYEDINDRLKDIWEFCLPGENRNLPRELLLKRMNIQVEDPYKYTELKGV